jgi:hypothetical protein
MFKNTSNATLSYYKGIIRDLDSKLKNALTRIKKLEEQVRKFKQVSPREPDNLETFGHQTLPLSEEGGILGGGYIGGLNRTEILALVNSAIEQGLLKIPIHDHTANDKGGDCYAGLGAKLV